MSAIQLSDCPDAGLDSQFPDTVYVVGAINGKWACCCDRGRHGLASFEDPNQAGQFALSFLPEGSFAIAHVTFDGALNIAKNRPNPIDRLFLLSFPPQKVIGEVYVK